MMLSVAPFIVPQHEHDVDLAAATVIPLIFLTTLLPNAPDDPKGKRFQYATRGLTVVAGFAALVTAFLQLAGEETIAGTTAIMVLLLVTSFFAICAMAGPIVTGIGIVTGCALWFLAGLILYSFIAIPVTMGIYHGVTGKIPDLYRVLAIIYTPIGLLVLLLVVSLLISMRTEPEERLESQGEEGPDQPDAHSQPGDAPITGEGRRVGADREATPCPDVAGRRAPGKYNNVP
jgi:hypothetical protein